MTSGLDTRQSELIRAMRFPLIVLVLFEHSVGADLAPMRWSLDGPNIFHFTIKIIHRQNKPNTKIHLEYKFPHRYRPNKWLDIEIPYRHAHPAIRVRITKTTYSNSKGIIHHLFRFIESSKFNAKAQYSARFANFIVSLKATILEFNI